MFTDQKMYYKIYIMFWDSNIHKLKATQQGMKIEFDNITVVMVCLSFTSKNSQLAVSRV